MVPREGRAQEARIKVAPRIKQNYSSLTDGIVCQGRFLLAVGRCAERIIKEEKS